MPNVEDGLGWQIYFKKNDDCTDSDIPIPFTWIKTGKPVTLESAYPELKAIYESDKVSNETKTENIKNKAYEAEISLLKIERDKLEAKQKALLEENERLKCEIEELKKQIKISTTKAKTKAKSEFKQGHRHKKFTNEQAEEIVKMKEQGISNVKIGEAFHCSERTVRNYLKTFRN